MRRHRSVLVCLAVGLAAVGSAQSASDKEQAFVKRVADAVTLAKTGKYAEARKEFEALHTENPRSYEALSWLGYIYLRDDEPTKAVPLLEQASAQRPGDVQVEVNLGNAYLATKQYDLALARYATVIRLDAKLFEPHYNAGTILLQQKQYTKAITEFQTASKLKPEDPFVFNNLGVAYEAQHDDPRAANAFVHAAKMRPDNRTFSRNAGLVLSRLGRSEALPYLEQANGDGKDSAVALALGEAYARAGRKAEALKFFEGLRTQEAKNSAFWFNLGYLREDAKDLAGAEQAYRRVLELSPSDLDALGNLGILLYRQGKYSEATTLFDRLAGLNPGSVQAKINLGAAAAKAGDNDKAIQAWKDVIRAEPGRSQVRLDLATALYDSGDVDGARYHYLQVLKNDKDNAEALNGVGLCYLKAGKLPQSEAAFRSATEARKDYPTAWNNLAVVLARMGRRTEAIKVLEQAVKQSPKDEGLRQNLERMRAGEE